MLDILSSLTIEAALQLPLWVNICLLYTSVPIKGSDSRLSDIQKYGGYNKAAGTYFMLIESEDKKGQPMRTIEYVPLYLSCLLYTSRCV